MIDGYVTCDVCLFDLCLYSSGTAFLSYSARVFCLFSAWVACFWRRFRVCESDIDRIEDTPALISSSSTLRGFGMEFSLLSLVVGGFYCALYFVGILNLFDCLRVLLLLLLLRWMQSWHLCTCVLAGGSLVGLFCIALSMKLKVAWHRVHFPGAE